MKKIFFLLLLTIGVISCEKESLETEISLEEINQEEPQKAVLGPLNENPPDVTYTDESGRIEFVISGIFVNTPDVPNPNLLSGTAYVPEGYLCIGGFAWANPYHGGGTLLTMSAPLTGTNAFKGWRGEVKAHIYPDGYTNLVVSAIGIRLKDNNGNYIPAEELKRHLQIISRTSSRAAHPSTFARLSSGYTLIGGGAKVNWSGAGNLLTQTYPLGNTWRVKSKDHVIASPATITAYAIGIKNNIPNFGSITASTTSKCKNFPAYKTGSVLDNSPRNTGYGVTIGGAKITANGNGRLLTAISTGTDVSWVKDKDHATPADGQLCAYTIAIKKAQ